jgi:transposase-like protein
MNGELETTLEKQISDAWQTAQRYATAATENASEALRSAVICGQLLATARANMPHGLWGVWLSDTARPFNISQETARRWMRLAEAHNAGELPDGAISQRDALQAIGLLKSATREPGQQKAAASACKWLSVLTKATAELSLLAERGAFAEMEEVEKFTLVQRLKVFADLYRELSTQEGAE